LATGMELWLFNPLLRELLQVGNQRIGQGTMEWKAVNIIKDNYVAAWKDAIIPALKQAILEIKIPKPTKKNPLLLQDNNAKPHRGLYKDRMDVLHYICHLATENGVLMESKDPAQPAQSLDLNSLDTFIFRLIAGI
jgi:hypothetical protein